MGRRFIFLVVLALTVGFGVRMTLAQGEAPASLPPVEALPAPAEMPSPSSPTPATELPSRATPTGGAPGSSAKKAPGLKPKSVQAQPAPGAGARAGAAPTESFDPSVTKELAVGDGTMPSAPPPADPAPPQEVLDLGSKNPFPAPGAPSPSETPAPTRDADVERSQAPLAASPTGVPATGPSGAENNPLPAAKEPAGQSSASLAPNEADELVLSPERLRTGVQSAGLSVEVKGPATLNLNTPATYKIIVSNPGTADAIGVVVRDALPPELEFVSSQPQEQRGPDTLLVWHLGTVRAGSKQEILLKVKPTKTGPFDHAVTVTMRSGAKSRTTVYQPKLRVEQSVTSAKVLKGQTVEYRISVTNTGDGPARDVIVRAKLSPGLRADASGSSDQNLFELSLGDLLPNQHVALDPLVADAYLGGEQFCKVDVTSPDVAPGAEEARSTKVVTVIEPKLAVRMVGPKERYTDTIASYAIAVENPGTAKANNVRVQVTVPVNAQLVKPPAGSKFDIQSRRLTWDAFPVEPLGKVNLGFEVRMGGPRLYELTVQAVGDQGLNAKEITTTDVIPLADIALEISEDRRVIDVNQTTTFTISVKNKGSKAATKILISGRHSPEVTVTKTAGTEEPARYKQDAAGKPVNGEFLFPMIERLDIGQEIVLGIQVQAIKTGLATCRIYVTHDDIEQPVEDMEKVRVTQAVGK
ncbi:conserved repeat domain-containing protein [Singulisphaera sp. GP187]|uniref:DUF11 domain-containing protein n=1 Tax=Singulisphaera sp. GP187 TaxID=1882752 RepID=UPI000928A7C8|nr:DUF11 domain-containing protein [Singulisphaera sp. GP187]SIN79866.1 conserved repeat domain-containing protein [Singulisphaera sp. GP187]